MKPYVLTIKPSSTSVDLTYPTSGVIVKNFSKIEELPLINEPGIYYAVYAPPSPITPGDIYSFYLKWKADFVRAGARCPFDKVVCPMSSADRDRCEDLGYNPIFSHPCFGMMVWGQNAFTNVGIVPIMALATLNAVWVYLRTILYTYGKTVELNWLNAQLAQFCSSFDYEYHYKPTCFVDPWGIVNIETSNLSIQTRIDEVYDGQKHSVLKPFF